MSTLLPDDMLRAFAKSDFKHDFNEGKVERDRFDLNDVERFKSILQRYALNKQVQYIKQFENKFVGDNLYTLFGPSKGNPIVASIFPGGLQQSDTGENGQYGYMTEEDILKSIGLDYQVLKNEIKGELDQQQPPDVYNGSDITISPHTYTVRAAKYKNQDGSTKNISTIFRQVTGGARGFALQIDATGGLSTTSILNNKLGPSPDQQCEFFIINNIENDADSATKLANFEKGDSQSPNPQPNVFFLRDKESTVVYPFWGQDTTGSTNLYSGGQVVLNRVNDDEIEANVNFTNTNESYNFGDVANTSNVKNASLNAVASHLVKSNSREQFIFPLLKRMGDWCQALSLLDRSRVYQGYQLNPENNKKQPLNNTTTLEDLAANQCEIGIVTNDRILLAFSLSLGLNVFFTTAFDVASLIYFKNQASVASITDRINTLESVRNGLRDEVFATVSPFSEEEFTNLVNDVKGTPELKTYLLKVKGFFSTLGRMRLNYNTYRQQLIANEPTNEDQDDGRLAKLSTQISILTKLKQDYAYDTGTLSQLTLSMVYPNSSADDIAIDALIRAMERGFDIKKTEAYLNVEKMILSIRDDIKQIEQKEELRDGLEIFKSVKDVDRNRFYAPNNVGTRRTRDKYNESVDLIFEVINKVLNSEVQQGGGHDDLDSVLTALQTLQIELYDKATPITAKNDQGVVVDTYEEDPVTVKRKSYYTDEKSHSYSVLDNYIVTKDNLDDFDRFFRNINEPDPTLGRPKSIQDLTPDNQEKTIYVCRRFLLLYHDLLRERLQKLQEEIPREPQPELDPDYVIKVFRVYAEIYNFDATMRQSDDMLTLASLLHSQMRAEDGLNDTVFNVYNTYPRTQDPFVLSFQTLERIRNDLFPTVKAKPIAERPIGVRNPKALAKTVRAKTKGKGRHSTYRKPI
jgi:hypothetical protein